MSLSKRKGKKRNIFARNTIFRNIAKIKRYEYEKVHISIRCISIWNEGIIRENSIQENFRVTDEIPSFTFTKQNLHCISQRNVNVTLSYPCYTVSRNNIVRGMVSESLKVHSNGDIKGMFLKSERIKWIMHIKIYFQQNFQWNIKYKNI